MPQPADAAAVEVNVDPDMSADAASQRAALLDEVRQLPRVASFDEWDAAPAEEPERPVVQPPLGGLWEQQRANATVLVVCDPADEARAAQLVDALQQHVPQPMITASSPSEAREAARGVHLAFVLVSEELEKNEALFKAVSRTLAGALVPVIVDSRMAHQKAWRGELERTMANEVYFDFREPDAALLSVPLRLIRLKVTGVRPVQWDVFLSHEWSMHSAAQDIAECLERDYGLRVWLDTEDWSGGLNQPSVSHGIESSKVFLVLATKAYMKKINDDDREDRCREEFRLACKQRSDRIVVAALEAELAQGATGWRGLFQLALSRQTPVDVCSRPRSDDAIERLAEAIRQRIRTPHASSDLSNGMRYLHVRLTPCSSKAWAQGKAAKFTVGTRSPIFDELGDWYKSQSPVFVLVGDGGVGKSVIMAEICSRGGAFGGCSPEAQPRRKSSRLRSLWRRSGKQQRPAISVAAYHFFRHDDKTAASPHEALTSIIWQLCECVPDLTLHVHRQRPQSFKNRTLADVFKTLLVGSLKKLEPTQERQVVVLDAVNECKGSVEFLDTVIRPWSKVMPPWLSLVVSTRPEGHTVRGLDLTVVELKSEQSFRDIELHLERLLHDMNDIVERTDVKTSAQSLAMRSEGVFLWTCFIPGALRDAFEAKSGQRLLAKNDIEKEGVISAGLDGMFEKYFGRLRDEAGGPETYAMLLAPIVTAREPLELKKLAALLGKRERETKTIVDGARNLLDQNGDGRVALLHKRVADWLIDDGLSGDLGIDVENGHGLLAAYCREHGDDYALRHAVYHLVRSGDEAGAFDLLNEFSWVQKVVSFGEDEAQRRATIVALLRDCAELGIDSAPETYTPQLLNKSLSALCWNPNELASQVLARLKIRDEDRDHPLLRSLREPSGLSWLRPVCRTLPHPHDTLPHVHEGHSSRVTSLAVDGDRVVSGSYDSTVCIWHAATGALQHVLEGHSDWVNRVALEGDRVVSGSVDKTARIWNAATGALQHVLEGHSGGVWAVAVGGSRVVSGSTDKTARIWNATTGALQHVLRGHDDWVRAVALEGDRVVSGSDDTTICIWDATTGSRQRRIGCNAWTMYVALKDDRLVAFCNSRRVVRIWNVATRAELDEDELNSFRGSIPGDHQYPTHVKLLRDRASVGFSADHLISASVQRGEAFVVGDAGGMVHFLRAEMLQ